VRAWRGPSFSPAPPPTNDPTPITQPPMSTSPTPNTPPHPTAARHAPPPSTLITPITPTHHPTPLPKISLLIYESSQSIIPRCEVCSFTIYPARGREFKFFPAGFKCPSCGAPKEKFYDLTDPDDPRNREVGVFLGLVGGLEGGLCGGVVGYGVWVRGLVSPSSSSLSSSPPPYHHPPPSPPSPPPPPSTGRRDD
jgi:rubredoxin